MRQVELSRILFTELNNVAFEPSYSQNTENFYSEQFIKMAITRLKIDIFEFCKNHCVWDKIAHILVLLATWWPRNPNFGKLGHQVVINIKMRALFF